ncbi:hypothetical protein FJT64_002289 [Amphibalanus amphitrite]|uniref:Uncharacterized protein n=2 Tax=Amphibalanus amphitrite TaxID=1232801 RepID=A0A6A4WY14_AMPAM|nr:hypothetical protein FJT64_002289 [Amphibalanus amphitrite]
MGSRAVLDNIRYFLLHLLPRAEAGAPWTEPDLGAALRWADYCEQATAAADGTPAEPVLRRFVTTAAGGARCDLNVALLRRSRRELLSRLLQNGRAGDAALRRALAELRRAGQLDSVLAGQAAQKQAYCALTAALRRAGGRRRMQALAFRRYLLEGAMAGRPAHWLTEKATELVTGPDGARMAALALKAAPTDGGAVLAAVDGALERQLAAVEDVGWMERLSEPELRTLLARPGLVTAVEAACDRLTTAGEDGEYSSGPHTALLSRAAECDPSGRVRRKLRAVLLQRGDVNRSDCVRITTQLPRFQLKDPVDELESVEAL